MKCYHCGCEISDSAKYCLYCGKRVGDARCASEGDSFHGKPDNRAILKGKSQRVQFPYGLKIFIAVMVTVMVGIVIACMAMQ